MGLCHPLRRHPKADLKTDDGAVKTDTDGNQLGGSIEGGKLFALTESLTLEPSLGAFYTQIDFDNIRDGAGKTAKFETVGYWELEGGIKLEKLLLSTKEAPKFISSLLLSRL